LRLIELFAGFLWIRFLLLLFAYRLIQNDQLLEVLEQSLNEAEEPLEQESLSLLKQHLLEPSLSPALVEGLLKNIQDYPNCKWIAFLLRNYLKLNSIK